ncbi:MAG: Rpn family recombination-promoting nuclease/putative transposase, partial [Acidaminococcaceae bacterium]|nr:Rpn family recombination-promoting nuclease/putative transposase [Acidaminococcaceae bacterium]
IRLDVYVMDENGTVLDIEMQTTGPNSTIYRDTDEETVVRELPLRTRYYQSIASMDMLRRGMHYNELRRSYVIFICTFDPFKEGLPVYHFTYRCGENNALEMGDLTENIFLNAKAADKATDKELAAFLSYVNGKAPESEFTQTVEKETARVKDDTYWRERIMTWEMDMKVIEKRMEKRMEKTISERMEKEYEEKYRKSVKEAAVKAEMEKSLEIAKNMLNDGMDIDKVARLTNLSLEEVAALR